ncbi:MAG: YkgJ family cysteine cluster protein [Bacteroidales bacterium]|nr:YkgJ family cysteine cluster protein [Bacteroidales bacterium]MBN2757775.1 YkgJ family cysteine cluster protein [Bacteroidales bacterium]
MAQKKDKFLIEDWNKRKIEIQAENKKFTKKLSRLSDKKLIEAAEGVHDKVFAKIDCLDCANCCKSIPPIINETDARRIAKHLGMKVTAFKDQYVKIDEDMDMVMNQSPCPFLQADNTCIIYEFRPKACREYPHTENYELTKKLKLHAINAQYCPAVFHILEELKTKL